MAIITVDTTSGLGDYSSAAAALLSLDGVTLTETTTITCAATDGNADTSPLVIPDVTAAADKRLVIAAADGHHAGVAWDDSIYRLSLGSVSNGIDVGKFYISIIGLQVEHSCPAWGATIKTNSGTGDLWIDGCYVRNIGVAQTSQTYGIGSITSVDLQHGVTVVNTIVEGPYVTGIRANGNSDDGVFGLVYNCTAIGCTAEGISRGNNGVSWARTIAINCLEVGCGGSVLDSTSFATGTDYNITDVDITPVGAHSLGNTTVGFVSGTYQPVAGSAVDGAGADLSAHFTTDILGNTRTVPWDVGAAMAAAASETIIHDVAVALEGVVDFSAGVERVVEVPAVELSAMAELAATVSKVVDVAVALEGEAALTVGAVERVVEVAVDLSAEAAQAATVEKIVEIGVELLAEAGVVQAVDKVVDVAVELAAVADIEVAVMVGDGEIIRRTVVLPAIMQRTVRLPAHAQRRIVITATIGD